MLRSISLGMKANNTYCPSEIAKNIINMPLMQCPVARPFNQAIFLPPFFSYYLEFQYSYKKIKKYSVQGTTVINAVHLE